MSVHVCESAGQRPKPRVLTSAPVRDNRYISPAMKRCNNKAQTLVERQLVQSGEAQSIAPVDQFTLVEAELASRDPSFQLVESQNQHEDSIRARIPRIACCTVTYRRRQKNAAGLYDHNRQRHTQLCP